MSSNSPPGSDDPKAPAGLGGRPSRPGPSQVPPPPSDKPTILRSPRAALEPESVPALKRRSKRVRHPLVIAGNAVFTFLVIVFLAVGAALYLGKQRFEAPGPLTEDKSVNISRGLGIRDIAALLEREGVIDQPYVFIGGVTVMKARGGLKHGEYRFTKHASMSDVIETMIEGKVVQHALTIPEGLTSEQIVAKLLQNAALTGQIKEIPREGSLLPETYKFTRGATRAQIIKRMQQAEQREVKEIWAHRMSDLPISTPEELVTLASIVEKETGKQGERSRVAAVFVNRLKSKMKLQSDPTIIYGLTGGKGSLGRPILKSEIEQPTPYNTYVINGLPPGPIANPGKASLEAVASPARTKDLFFVADGAGGHVFSETYEQHQKNVAKLRARERAQSKPAAEPAPEKAPEKTPETAPEKKNGDKP